MINIKDLIFNNNNSVIDFLSADNHNHAIIWSLIPLKRHQRKTKLFGMKTERSTGLHTKAKFKQVNIIEPKTWQPFHINNDSCHYLIDFLSYCTRNIKKHRNKKECPSVGWCTV